MDPFLTSSPVTLTVDDFPKVEIPKGSILDGCIVIDSLGSLLPCPEALLLGPSGKAYRFFNPNVTLNLEPSIKKLRRTVYLTEMVEYSQHDKAWKVVGPVVVKHFHTTYILPGSVEDPQREVNSLAYIHANLKDASEWCAKLIEACTHPSSKETFLILEFIEGKDLVTMMKHLPGHVLSPLEASMYFYQVVDILQRLHSIRVVHMDVKHENIMVRSDGSVVLIDFGAATLIPEEVDGEHTLVDCMQGATPPFMAPEVSRFEPSSGYCADMWSLGVTFLGAITGKLLPKEGHQLYHFLESGRVNLLLAHRERAQKLPYALADDQGMCDLIQGMLYFNESGLPCWRGRLNIFEIKEHSWWMDVRNSC